MFDETSHVHGGGDKQWAPVAGEKYESRTMERKSRNGKQLSGDEQYASYFMTGGLEHQAPLKHERNVQRNKAIFLLVFFLVILIAVLYAALK